jgi:hypothetical protein
MTATALVVFLFLFLTSLIAHAEHLTSSKLITEQKNCQLCNQEIDIPLELLAIQGVCDARYNPFIAKVTTAEFIFSQFLQPLLRAPPFIR